MIPTERQLLAAHCLFDTDRATGTEMTAFKRTARYRQHLWALDQGIEEFGTHKNSKARIAAGEPAQVLNGTKLSDLDANLGKNFLSTAIRDVAERRVENKQPGQTLQVGRLRRDLLSSMPMAFNLFGEASLRDESKKALSELLAPGADGPVEIDFEWSPERGSENYTRDRTAFDVTLKIGAGPKTVVGIETKYHEHSAREATPNPKRQDRWDNQTKFLRAIANRSGVFEPGWEAAVLDTDLRQIWRDHLLALSMREHPAKWTAATRYVLIYPEGNGSYRDAAERYTKILTRGSDSFAYLTVEGVLDAAFAHGGSKERFAKRYLW